MNKLLPIEAIIEHKNKYIAFMCFDIYETIDGQILNLQFKILKEQLSGGSYMYYCNGKYRTKKTYIDSNKVDVLGLID